MITLRHTVSALAVSTLLVFGGCKKKDQVSGESAANAMEKVADKASESVKGALGLDRVGTADLNKYFKVKPRKSSDADQALAALGMNDGNAVMSWDSVDGSNGNYVYKNVSLKSAEGNVAVKRMELKGVHMADGDGTFDTMELSDISLGNGQGSIDSLKMAQPHPKVAASIVSGLSQLNSLDDLDMNVDVDGAPFGALMIEGLNITGEEGSAKADVVGWGSDEVAEKGSMLVSNLQVDAVSDAGAPASVSIATISAKDVDLKLINSLRDSTSGNTAGVAGVNPMGSGSGSIMIEDMNIVADAMRINLESLQSKTEEKGDIVSSRTILKPMTIKMDGETTDTSLMQIKSMLSQTGVSDITLSGDFKSSRNKATDELSISDSYLSVQDMMDLNFSGKMSGMSSAEANPDAVTLHNFSFDLTDRNFLDMAFKIAGEQNGVTGPEMRQQAAGLIALAALSGQIPANMTTPLSKFVNDGGTLSLSINPAAPMSMSQLQTINDPADLEKMGLSLSHRK